MWWGVEESDATVGYVIRVAITLVHVIYTAHCMASACIGSPRYRDTHGLWGSPPACHFLRLPRNNGRRFGHDEVADDAWQFAQFAAEGHYVYESQEAEKGDGDDR